MAKASQRSLFVQGTLLANQECEKQVVSNSNSFLVPERKVTSAKDSAGNFAPGVRFTRDRFL